MSAIVVFPSDATDFTGLGLGAVTPSACTVRETLNGEWEIELTHPLDENGKWERLARGNIVRAPVPAATTPALTGYADEPDAPTVMKTTSRVNLRVKAGMEHPTICMVPGGTDVIVLTDPVQTYWAEVVIPDGRRGYMSKLYMEAVQAPATRADAVKEIVESRPLRDQPFRIYRVVPTLTDVTVYARHIFYDLLDNMVQSYVPGADTTGAQAAAGLMNACQTAHGFTVYSDLTTTAEGEAYENVNPVEALLGESGIAARYGGEIARDWFDVYAVRRVGRDTDIVIAHGKNLLSAKIDVDETDVTTRIMPTGETKDGETLYLDEVYIDSERISNYPHPKWTHLHVAEAKIGTDGLTRAQALEKMRDAANKAFADGCDLPKTTLDVDFVRLADTEEYARYAPMTDLFLGDSATVKIPKLNVTTRLRVTQYEYDCLLRRYRKMTLGMAADTLSDMKISSRQIPSGGVTGQKIALHSVGTGQMRVASIGSAQIMAAAIDTANIADAAITRGQIADAAIGTAQIDDAAITSAKITDASVTRAKIGSAAVGSAQIADAAITRAKIQSAAIGTAQIETGAITTAQIETGAITTALIGTGAVETAQIADGSITDAKIVSLTANKLTAGTIDASVIQVNNLTADNITTGTINGQRIPVLGTEKIADGAVTGDKVAPNAITADKIVTGAVTTDKLAANAVTANKIAANAVTAGKIEAGAVKAEHIEAGAVTAAKIADIDGALNIVSGGSMNIASGDFLLRAGSQAGEYLGISSTGETTIFTGAENAAGDNPKFSLSKYGEASMRDANISGEIEVMGAMTLGEGVTVEFRDAAARYNFLRAMAGGDALPYNMGGTNAATRENAMRNMSLMVGMDKPSAANVQNIGDRYLLVKPGTTTAANTVALARNGCCQTKTSNQRRLVTQRTYFFHVGDSSKVPSNTTTYSSWSETGTPTYGDLTAASAAYCHEANGTVSNQYNGAPTDTESTGWYGTQGEQGYTEWDLITRKQYQYRTYTRQVYRAVLPAPTAGVTDADIKSLSVKTALLTLTTDAAESGKYSLSLADSADGQTGKALIGTATGTTSVSFSLLDVIQTLYGGAKYLVIERAGSSAAIMVTAAALAFTYFSGARRTEEYAWNGAEWRPLALGSEYFFDESNDATVAAGDYLFTVPITDGGEGAQYEFEFLGKANANSTTNFILCLNGDNVYANYRSRVIYGSNVYSERARIGNTGAISTPTFARGTITVIGGYVVVTGQGMWSSYNTAYSVVYGDGETELTAINIRMENAAAGVGCRMKVKRK